MRPMFTFDPDKLRHILTPVEELPPDHPDRKAYEAAVAEAAQRMKREIDDQFIREILKKTDNPGHFTL